MYGKSRRAGWRQRGVRSEHECQEAPRLFAESPSIIEEWCSDAGLSAVADQNRDVLYAFDLERHWRRDDAETGVEAPQARSGGRVVGQELAAAGPLKHEVSRRSQRAAVPEAVIAYFPRFLLSDWIPGQEGPGAVIRVGQGKAHVGPDLHCVQALSIVRS